MIRIMSVVKKFLKSLFAGKKKPSTAQEDNVQFIPYEWNGRTIVRMIVDGEIVGRFDIEKDQEALAFWYDQYSTLKWDDPDGEFHIAVI